MLAPSREKTRPAGRARGDLVGGAAARPPDFHISEDGRIGDVRGGRGSLPETTTPRHPRDDVRGLSGAEKRKAGLKNSVSGLDRGLEADRDQRPGRQVCEKPGLQQEQCVKNIRYQRNSDPWPEGERRAPGASAVRRHDWK